MKLTKMALMITVAGLLSAQAVFAQDVVRQPSSVLPIAFENVNNMEFDQGSYYSQDADAISESNIVLGDEAGAACDSCGGGGCGRCWDFDLRNRLQCCEIGEPWSLWDEYGPCDPCINIGMWTQLGWHDEGNGLFNNHPDRFNLHQQYLYIEKVAQGGQCCLDWGFRFDVMYGVDGDLAQSFGNDAGEWDFLHGYDHGIYAWAIPQMYAELAYNRFHVKLGHFYTPAGYEVVTAPGNFFYSHAITHVLSEPFTHTGSLVTYQWDTCTEVYAGHSFGWDTGFNQFAGGNSFMGGFSRKINDDITFTYIANVGDFGRRSLDDEKSYAHSVVIDVKLNDCWTYVLSSDALRIEEQGEDNLSWANYLFYNYSDCLSFGTRLEWWKGDAVTNYTYGGRIPAVPAGSHSYYEWTFGANYKPCANIVLRPEVRYDWAPFASYDQTIFAFDVVMTY